jgi:hypothetical protein
MGRGHAKDTVEPQHDSLQSAKLYPILTDVRSGGDIARRSKTLKPAKGSRDPNMSKRS